MLNDLKASIISEIYAKTKSVLNAISVKYSAAEMAMWDTIKAESIEFSSSGVVGVTITKEAEKAGISKEAYAHYVLNNVNFFDALRIDIIGVRNKHVTAVNMCTSVDELSVYDWNTDWQV